MEPNGTAQSAAQDPRIAAGLVELAAAAERLRDLDLEGEEPGTAFDPAWPSEDRR